MKITITLYFFKVSTLYDNKINDYGSCLTPNILCFYIIVHIISDDIQ